MPTQNVYLSDLEMEWIIRNKPKKLSPPQFIRKIVSEHIEAKTK